MPGENQEVPVMVEDIRAAARRIAANCREARPETAPCPDDCPGLLACGLAGGRTAQKTEVRRLESLRH